MIIVIIFNFFQIVDSNHVSQAQTRRVAIKINDVQRQMGKLRIESMKLIGLLGHYNEIKTAAAGAGGSGGAEAWMTNWLQGKGASDTLEQITVKKKKKLFSF
jgi:hypothetical protein